LQTVTHEANDEDSELSDLDMIQARQIIQLQNDVTILNENYQYAVKSLHGEMTEKISK